MSGLIPNKLGIYRSFLGLIPDKTTKTSNPNIQQAKARKILLRVAPAKYGVDLFGSITRETEKSLILEISSEVMSEVKELRLISIGTGETLCMQEKDAIYISIYIWTVLRTIKIR